MFVLPMMIAPAPLSFEVTVASCSGSQSAKILLPAVVILPPTAMLSFSATGRPWSGPSRWPAMIIASDAFATWRASSA